MFDIVIGVLFALVAFGLAYWSYLLQKKHNSLKEMEAASKEMLEQIELKRAALVVEQKTLNEQKCRVAPFLGLDITELNASYAVSESDAMKFNSLSAIKKNARKKLTFNLANDIIKKFPEPKCKDGVYWYRFRITEVE